MFIFDDTDELIPRKYSITLPASLWTQFDELVARSEAAGKKINIEKSLSKVLADEIRRAAKRGRRQSKDGAAE